MTPDKLLEKYDVPGPRYTSYPTVPYWDHAPTPDQWIAHLNQELTQGKGVALYVHIPFCEQLCTFCACNKQITKKHERGLPYVHTVLREWGLYLGQLKRERISVSHIHLGGGTPTWLAADELKILMDGLLAFCDLTDDYELSLEIDPRVTTRDQLQVLYDVGFRRISMGVQDFDPRVQDVINRVQSVDMVRDVTNMARDVGYDNVNYDLVYGLPLQNVKSIENTILHVRDLKPDRLAFYGYAHVPWVGKTGQRKFTDEDVPRGAQKRALYDIGRRLLAQAGYTEIGMDHFSLPHDRLAKALANKKLFRNFMGYTDVNVSPMIGLGVSAIGDAWSCFAQNEKDLAAYEQNVANGLLPVMRGHVLTQEDLVLRRHILNLMTQLHTSWDAADLFTSYLDGVQDRLQEFVADGLVEVSDRDCVITEKGRAFMRNICMAFDARLARMQPNTQLFSQTI